MGFPKHGDRFCSPRPGALIWTPNPNGHRGLGSAAVPAQASAASKGPWWHGGRLAGFLSTILDGIYQER